MPDLPASRRVRTAAGGSLLTSLGVSLLLILGYIVGLGMYSSTSQADAAVENGVRVTVDKLYVRGDRVSVVLPDGDIDELNYVSDPEDYRAPLEAQVWLQPANYDRVDRLVFAVQDLDHLRGNSRKRLIAIGFGALVVLFLGSAVYLNWPRKPDPDE